MESEPRDRASREAVGDETFVALSDRVRRVVLYVLQSNQAAKVDELADVVTGWLNADREGVATRADRDRVYAALRDRHIPVLLAADLIDYDDRTERVSIAPLPDPVRSLLSTTYRSEGGTDARP